MNEKKNKIIIICGATGVGKTSFSIEIAKKISGEIINCDIAQHYKFLEIGTAAPSKMEKENINHHLFNEEENVILTNAYDYAEKIEKKCEEIIKNNKIPIIAGGSAFYIYSLFFKNKAYNKNKTNKKIYNFEKNKKYTIEEKTKLWNELKNKNKERAEKININDVYRMIIALNFNNNDILEKLSFEPKYNYIILNKKIENMNKYYVNLKERIRKMFEDGWLNEVKNLKEKEKAFVKDKKFIGYDLILEFIENRTELARELTFEQLTEKIFVKTKQYKKKQLLFIKKMRDELLVQIEEEKKTVTWIDINNKDDQIKLINNIEDIIK